MIGLLTILVGVLVLVSVVALRLAWRGRAAGADPGTRARARARAKNAPPTNVAILTQYELWMRRVEREQLGTLDGNWAEFRSTPQYVTWRRLAEARGAGDDVPRYMTRALLSEVIYAAGGVEREFRQIRTALADGQHAAGEPAPAGFPAPQGQPNSPPAQEQPISLPAQEQPVSRPHVAAPSMRDASYSFVNLLGWARSTAERTDRPYRPGSPQRAGLLPALADGQLRDGVDAALRHLRAALQDSRLLASYAFHAGAVPDQGTPGAQILPDGGILARLADPLKDPVLTWEGLEFTERRDLLACATELMAAIEIFVDRVLDVFATARPAAADPRTGSVEHRQPGELRVIGSLARNTWAATPTWWPGASSAARNSSTASA